MEKSISQAPSQGLQSTQPNGPWGGLAAAVKAAPRDEGLAPKRTFLFRDVANVYADVVPGRDTNRLPTVAMWVAIFGDLYVDEITRADVEAAMRELLARPAVKYAGIDHATGQKIYRQHGQRAPATLNRMLSVLSSVFKFAQNRPKEVPPHRWQRFLSSSHPLPTAAVQRLEVPRPIDRTLPPDDVQSLLVYAKANPWPRMYLFVLLLLTSGARRSEVLFLRGRDLDLASATPTAALHTTKNEEPRRLVLTPAVVREIRRIGVPASDDFLFPARMARAAGKPYAVDAPFGRLAKRAGLTTQRMHDLRHTAGGMLADEGRSVLEIADVLGHKDVRSTQRYAHRSVKAKAALIESSSLAKLR